MQVEGQHGRWQHHPMATGALVSNTYATCLLQGDNPEKFGLIPHSPREGILLRGKLRREEMGMRRISLLAGRRPTKATMRRGSERKVPHTGTETRTRLLREAAVRNIGQWTVV